MKILYLYDFPLWGNGSSTYLRKLIEQVSKKHDVAIIAPDRRKLPNTKQFFVKPPFAIPVFIGHPELQGSKKYSELSAIEVNKLIKAFRETTVRAVEKFKPDIIHINHIGMLAEIARYAYALTGVPFIITTHGSDLKHTQEDRRFFELTLPALATAKRITAVSGHTRRWFLNLYRNQVMYDLRRKTNIIPGGINTAEYNVIQRTKTIDTRYNLHGKKVALFVGRLTEEKGVEYVARAAGRIQGEILIVGDGPEMKKLKKIRKEGKLKNLHLIGYLGRDKARLLHKIYTRADVVVTPSVVDEALGLVILEAMYFGKPVIATRKGGIPLAVKENETGLFAKPRNATDIAEKVNALFADEEKSKRMGENGYRMVKSKFTWEIIANKFTTLYSQSCKIANGNGVKSKKK